MVEKKPEHMERFKAAAARIRSGESKSEEVEVPSGRVRLTPDPTAPTGIKIEVLNGGSAGGAESPPNPETLAAMEKIKGVLEQFRTGERESAEIPLPSGETMQLTRDDRSPGAYRVRSTGGGPNMLSIPFEASPARPDHFPDDLPFLPDSPVALTEFEGKPSRTLTWFFVQDPEGRLRELRKQLASGGWEEKEETNTSTPFGTMVSIEFEMGGKMRTVMLNRFQEHSQIRLLDHAQDEDRFRA